MSKYTPGLITIGFGSLGLSIFENEILSGIICFSTLLILSIAIELNSKKETNE